MMDELEDAEEGSVAESDVSITSSPIIAQPALHDVFFRAPAGKLTCIVGPVGSGKTTLLHAILREISPTRGTVRVPKDIAYTPQSPWLLTATLRENVLFGRPMDQKRYDDVLVACALVKDLKLLQNGDLTEIGEQGINLSGGQKQRVSLARALYANPQCFILDEPLSAVDAHVATWLFDSCIRGMMEGTTRVLVTHQLQFLPAADSIVVLHQGKITHTGTYAQLVEQGIDFETLVRKKFEAKSEKSEEPTQPSETDSQGQVDIPTEAEAKDVVAESVDISEQLEAEPKEVAEGEEEGEKPGGIISKEERQLGQVGWKVYRDYFAASGYVWGVLGTLLVYVLGQVTFLLSEYWIVLWTSSKFDFGPYTYIIIFFGLVLLYASVKRVGTVLVQAITHQSARNLHQQLLVSVLSSKASFFDMTPTGRIINRFSKDQDVLDNSLPHVIQDCFECGVIVVCSIGLICIITPLFILPLIGLIFLYYNVQKFYRKSNREIKRLESISRSPIFSCFSESMNGLTTIRAFKREDDFISVINSRINANQKTIFYEFSLNRWLGVRLEWVASLVVLFASSFSILSMQALGPGLVGLLLTTTLAFSGNLNWVVRQYTDLEVQMNAVERILHYISSLPQEPKVTEITPADSWPHQGALDVRDLVVRYREDLDPVLCGISCSIHAGEKIGIVGRTGAGKSTLTTAIFRMVEAASGSISIDGVDISKIGLDVLRSRISIIPQEPVLFQGSIRMNMDPFLKHSETELWEALKQVHLKDHVASIPGQLDYTVEESGEGFSIGQRQLLCLARALLRRTKVLVMDEATASLDFKTDTLIKATVRECFASNTLITIAHRLDTILDSDRIMVFEQGKIAEFDSPTVLLANPTSKFTLLIEAARQAAERNHSRPTSNNGGSTQDPAALFNQNLELLLSTDVANQEYSLRVLINCALNEKNSTTLLEKIGKQGFEALFQSSSEVVQMLAAWLLSHITLDENICPKVVESGVLEACIPLLDSENVDVQEKGLWIFNNILLNDETGHFAAKFEIIDKFIKLFESSSPKIIKLLAQVLESLMRKDSYPSGYIKNQEIFLLCNGITAIAEILAPAFPPRELEALTAAVDLLSCLTLYNAKSREAVADSTAFSWVLTFVASPTTNTQLLEKSLQIAFNVSLEEHLLQHLVSRAAIPILVARLDSHPASRASLEMTLVVLANLMIDEVARLSFRKHGLANALLRVLLLLAESAKMFDNQAELEKTILEIAGNASCDEHLRIEFHSVGAVAHIESLDTHGSSEFAEMVSTAVTNLTIPVSDHIIQEWTNTGASLPSTIERSDSGQHVRAVPKVKSPIIREILESELSFVRKLRTFVRVYSDSITQAPEAPISKDLIGPLFLNINEILSIHTELLQELSRRFNADCILGDLFIEFGNKETVIDAYRIFFTGFENALTILAEQMAKSPSLEAFLAKCDKDKECNGLNFAAFLMMPIQRIKRYSVFLTEIQTSILPKNEDYTDSIVAMQGLERKLNEWHKEAQEHAKLAEIKKGLVHISAAFLLDALKEVLFEGLVVEYQPEGSHHVQIFLFSDIVIVCCFQVNSQKHRKIPYIEHKIKMQMENVIELNSLEVSELPHDKATGQQMMKFKWPDGESVFYVTDKELKQWFAAIEKARQM